MTFTSDTHLPQLLSAEAYTSHDQFGRESTSLFQDAWHCVAQTRDLHKEGAFKTVSLLGHPLILWRTKGEIRCYLNVCSHRHCLLTGKSEGTMPLLKCQYHGWEYDREGDTKRIPDARSFRPLAPGVLGLRQYRVKTVGQLVFVSLSADPGSLDEQLGGQRSYLEDLFSDRWAPLLTVAQEVNANWKVLAENVLEGYHLEEVHKNTFKKFAPADSCHHSLADRVTTYTEVPLEENRRVRQQADFFARLLSLRANPEYHHVFCYPNFAASRMTLFNWAQTILPVAPNKSVSYWQIFYLRGHSKTPWARFAATVIRRHGRKFFKEAMREDGVVMPGVQAGMAAKEQPSGGLISAREERIFHFQQFVQQHGANSSISDRPDFEPPVAVCEGGCHVPE